MTGAQRRGNAELFSTREEEISYATADAVSRVLGREVDQTEFENLWHDWRAFTENPEKYADTIVVDMVKLYLDEQ